MAERKPGFSLETSGYDLDLNEKIVSLKDLQLQSAFLTFCKPLSTVSLPEQVQCLAHEYFGTRRGNLFTARVNSALQSE